MTYPTIMPALTLDFQNSKQLDPRVTFSRSSSATYINSAGLVVSAADHEPRFDHDPKTGECLGLLIEEARTNAETHAIDFLNASWETDSSSVTPNATTAPDGTLTASKLVEASTTGGHLLQNSANLATTGQTWTFSIFAKAAERTELVIWLRSQPGALEYFDLSSGTKISDNLGSNSRITPFANGWYRISITDIVDSNRKPYIATAVNGSNSTNGDGVSGIFVWGAQLEVGPYPSSYIPTAGSTVTRSADVADITGDNFSSWYNQSEGTFYVDIDTDGGKNSARILSLSSSGTFRLLYYSAAPLSVPGTAINSYGGSSVGVSYYPGINLGDSYAFGAHRIALSYDTADSMSVDGTAAQTGTTGQGYSSASASDAINLRIFKSHPTMVAPSDSAGHISRFAYYNERLTDAELQTITL